VKRIVVLISGRGSNFQAIAEANLPVEIAAVISNRPNAAGLDYARSRGIPAVALDHTAYPTASPSTLRSPPRSNATRPT
jgi:phosphoribosylglycinamide formyltransferase 1